MLGIGTFILLGGAVKNGIENHEMMKKPHHFLDDGTPVYLDRLGSEYINGEKVVPRFNYDLQRLQQVGEISGRVYFDQFALHQKRMHERSEENKARAIADGDLAYSKYDEYKDKFITCEISTGMYIGKLDVELDGTCWKYYLYPDRTITSRFDMRATTILNSEINKKGIKISEEELKGLDIIDGSHEGKNCSNNLWKIHMKIEEKERRRKQNERPRAYLWKDEDFVKTTIQPKKPWDDDVSIFDDKYNINDYL